MSFAQHRVDTDALVRLPLPAILADQGFQVQQTGGHYFAASHPKDGDDLLVYRLSDGRWGYKNKGVQEDKGNALNFLMKRGQSFLNAAHTLEAYREPDGERRLSSIMRDLDTRFTQASWEQLSEIQSIPIGEIAEFHGWTKDDKESTQTWEKYRSPDGDSIVVNPEKNFYFHQQDKEQDKGGVLQFMQRHVMPNASLGDVRKALQPMLQETGTPLRRSAPATAQVVNLPQVSDRKEEWKSLPPLSDRSRDYLMRQRGLSDETLAAYAGSIRTDIHELSSGGHLHNVAFSHFAIDKDGHAVLSGWEKKGPGKDRTFTGFHGNKGVAVFRHKDFRNAQERDEINVGFCQNLMLCESSIDALSKAQIDGLHPGDIYVSMGGTPSVAGEKALNVLIRKYEPADIVLAFDNDEPGHAFAALLEKNLARHNESFHMPVIRTRTEFPEKGKDWNDQLRFGQGKEKETREQRHPRQAPAKAVNGPEIG